MRIVPKLRDEGFRTLLLTVVSGLFLLSSFFGWRPFSRVDPAWVAIALCGVPIVYGAVKGLITEFDVTADVLVAIALVAAVCIGQYFASGEVAFIMQLGKVLEDVTAGRTRKSLRALIDLTPGMATIRTSEGEKEIPASEVKPGDIVLVRPGEAIPVDGKIVRGSTSIDQSVMTGESVPVDRSIGDAVYQGTLNQQGAVDMEATTVGEDSSLKKMIRLVEEAERNKAPIVRIADTWARILVPVALGSSLLILLLTKDLSRAVTALVVFCPCSLILATPTAMMAAIGNATGKGILIKSGAAVEAAAKMDTIVLDKTGTLTCGKLQVDNIRVLDPAMSSDEFIGLVAGAEKFSEHPLGKAIVSYAQTLGIGAEDPEEFEMRTGKGISATVGGRKLLVGEKAVGQALLDESTEVSSMISLMQAQGKTVLPVAFDGRIAGMIAVADSIRREAGDAIAELKGIGIARTVMLTGDNQAVADAIGREAGVDMILASRLPEGKAEDVKRLRDQGHLVGMVGDGVNDAPALATASVGIVMGAIGTDVAIEAADIALMGDDIGKLPILVRICRKARRRIIMNIVISMCINFGAIVLAGFGILNPVTAAIVHNIGSVFVVVNSALLLTYREKGRNTRLEAITHASQPTP